MRGAPSDGMAGSAALVAQYITERSGLKMDGLRQTQLMDAVERGMRRAGAGNAVEYRALLQGQPAELDRLVADLTVGESYFFRDGRQIELLRDEVLPERAAAGPTHRTLQLWSAGCATGQEAYTLAMLAEEAGLAARVRILATDLSRHALDVAEAGVFREWSLRAVDGRRRSAYFRPVPEGFRVDDRFAAPITFRQHNLQDLLDEGAAMDVILCRNVLIYLTPEAVVHVAGRLASALAPSGWLLTAAGDPPLEADGLERVVTPAGVAYRRVADDRAAGASERAASPWTGQRPASTRPAAGPPLSRRRPQPAAEPPRRGVGDHPGGARSTAEPAAGSDRLERARLALDRTDYGTASTLARALVDGGDGGSEARAVLVAALANAGHVTEAVEQAAAAVAAFPLDADLRLLQALALVDAGRPEEAAEAARAAVYLDAGLALAHLMLAQAEASRGNRPAARRSLRTAAALFAAMDEDARVPHAGGETAARLAALARAHEGSLLTHSSTGRTTANGAPARRRW